MAKDKSARKKKQKHKNSNTNHVNNEQPKAMQTSDGTHNNRQQKVPLTTEELHKNTQYRQYYSEMTSLIGSESAHSFEKTLVLLLQCREASAKIEDLENEISALSATLDDKDRTQEIGNPQAITDPLLSTNVANTPMTVLSTNSNSTENRSENAEIESKTTTAVNEPTKKHSLHLKKSSSYSDFLSIKYPKKNIIRQVFLHIEEEKHPPKKKYGL